MVLDVFPRLEVMKGVSALPPEFCTFLEYSCLLSFGEKPNYDYLCGLFNDSLSREGLLNDMGFDWCSSGVKPP